jgi:hypothetical protein
MSVLLQDVIVTIAALGAAGVVVRRLFEFVQPAAKSAPGCPNCASSPSCGHTVSRQPAVEAKPLKLVRR